MKTLEQSEFDSGELVLHFECAESKVESTSLTDIIAMLSNIIRYINDQVDPGSEINIYVTSFESGSFRVRLKILKKYARKSAKKISIGVICGVISLLIYDAIILGFGWVNPANEGSEIGADVNQERNKEISEYNELIKSIYHRDLESIGYYIYRVSTIIFHSRSVYELRVFCDAKDSEPMIHLSKSSCERINKNYRMQTDTQSVTTPHKATILVRAAVFDRPESKWRITYEGLKISARIRDRAFLKQARAGKVSIRANERLEVIINVTEVTNKVSGYVKRREYEIEKVLKFLDK